MNRRNYKWHSYRGPGNVPQLDMPLSTLLDDLADRGPLETTLVVVMGEFGRTPRINKDGGHDHYPNAGCVFAILGNLIERKPAIFEHVRPSLQLGGVTWINVEKWQAFRYRHVGVELVQPSRDLLP